MRLYVPYTGDETREILNKLAGNEEEKETQKESEEMEENGNACDSPGKRERED